MSSRKFATLEFLTITAIIMTSSLVQNLPINNGERAVSKRGFDNEQLENIIDPNKKFVMDVQMVCFFQNLTVNEENEEALNSIRDIACGLLEQSQMDEFNCTAKNITALCEALTYHQLVSTYERMRQLSVTKYCLQEIRKLGMSTYNEQMIDWFIDMTNTQVHQLINIRELQGIQKK